MYPRLFRRARNPLRRRVLGATALLTAVGLTVLSQGPAQAGWADDNGHFTAAVYNQTPFDATYVEGWSQYGFQTTPSTAPSLGSALFSLNGSTVEGGGICFGSWRNSYNGWFTYRLILADGTTEFVTYSIHGLRSHSTILGCGWWAAPGDVYPSIDVWFTSTAPPSTWRYTDNAPPNVYPRPELANTQNTPQPFDQTISSKDGPGHGVSAIVSLGDSTISGEGGRWAGNTNTLSFERVDAGAHSYWDTATGESIEDCHRSESAEVHVGPPFLSKNFACSAAETHTYDWHYPWGWRFKPGVDLNCDVDVAAPDQCFREGQAASLYEYAATHNVKDVLVGVGANDFNFSGVVRGCMEDYLRQHLTGYRQPPCHDDDAYRTAISGPTRTKIAQDITGSLNDVAAAMTAAGYSRSQYTIIVQNYWSALPPNNQNRYVDEGTTRKDLGGCPIRSGDDDDLDNILLPAINDTVMRAASSFRSEGKANVRFLDVSHALDGHRLCERGVFAIEDIPGNTQWWGTDPKLADKLEWVTQARLDTIGTPYTLAEGGHANYWGQLAERNCLRQMVANPTNSAAGEKCLPGRFGGVNVEGEPNMSLSPFAW